MSEDSLGVVVATCYTMSGAQEVIAELARNGVSSRVSDEGVPVRIYWGPELNAPINFIRVEAGNEERAYEILQKAKGLEVILIDPEGKAVPVFEEGGGEAGQDDTVKLSEAEFYLRRAMILAYMSLAILPLGPFAIWMAFKVMAASTSEKESRRAWGAVAIALIPTTAFVFLLLLPILESLRQEHPVPVR